MNPDQVRAARSPDRSIRDGWINLGMLQAAVPEGEEQMWPGSKRYISIFLRFHG